MLKIGTEFKQAINEVATAKITTNTTSSTTASTFKKITLTTINTTTNNLTISDGGIRIGEGIHTVLVSGKIRYYCNNTTLGRRQVAIYKNNNLILSSSIEKTLANERFVSVNINDYLLDVVEGDILYLYSNSVATNEEISVGYYETYLTVKVCG